ncbi:MAG TPA: 6-bladed beta-propeller [Chthoniobacterales bacterium]|nr:6-bladed beta-propeller [Chthoniobacterales bacterium]
MLALLYVGVAICVGERLCSRFFRFLSVSHRWATGALVGLVLSSCFTYLAARHFAGSSNPLLWGDVIFFAAAAIFFLKCPPKRDLSIIEPAVPGSAKWDWITLGLYFALACWMMFATLDFKDGKLLIGITQWSDYGPNTAIVRNFAVGHNFPAEYPHFAGEPIRYHFLFYFLAGNLEFLGLNLVWSLNLLSILTLVCMLALVIALGQLLFKSRAVGRLASALFFFHGTLSLIPFLRKQTSFKGALLAIYNLRDYLSSGYPYRGEDWGIWTQVVFVNQRHLASSIGIFLVVLIFLFDRYLERAKEKQLLRAARPTVGKRPWLAAGRRSLGALLPARLRKRERKSETAFQDGAASDKLTSPEQLPPDPGVTSIPEAQLPDTIASLEEPSQAAGLTTVAEASSPDTRTDYEQSLQEPETVPVSDAQASGTLEPPKEPSSAANYSSASEPRTPDTVADNEQARLKPDPASESEVPTSDPATSHEESSQAAVDESAGVPRTFHTRAYDEYMRQGAASESEPRESEAVEVVPQSSLEDDTVPASEAQISDALPPSEQSPLEPALTSASEPPSPQASAPAPSRSFFAQIVHDNLVFGRGFIFCGFLLGLLPYWNAPVFTAAFAVLLFFFILFPYRRYMLGLAITTAVVGLPQVLALRSGNARAGASLIHWGYTLGNVPILQVLKYLGFTFGVKWLFILIALIFSSWVHWRLFISIFSLFLLTFCFQFSEEALANHKFLNIWLVLANLFVAYGCWRLWHARIKGWAIPSRLVALLLLIPILAGGVIDFFPIRNASFVYTNFTTDRLIKWIHTETKPDAIFLTDKFVNHPILLAGRRIWFGYTYFTWSAGYDLPRRETAYRQMFESKNAHQVFTLLKVNGIDYVAFDGAIRGFFKSSNEQQVYAPNFKKVFEGPEYGALTIYKVPENADFVPASSGPLPAGVQATGVNLFEGAQGKDNGQLNFPRGLTVDSTGNILVSDTNNDRLQRFSPTGDFLNVLGKRGSGPGDFLEPGGIAVDSSGNIYVADVSNHRVQKVKPDGTFLADWKGPEPGFSAPRDIGLGADNSIFVVDQGRSQVIRLDANGKVLVVWGTPGKDDGQFSGPTSLAVDGKNNKVYVADPSNKRIQVFDTNGKFLAKWVVEEWGTPAGWYFQDLAVDAQAGLLYASSNATDDVLVFDLNGKRVRSLKLEQFDKVVGAASLALTKNSLYVINTFAARVSRVELGKK